MSLQGMTEMNDERRKAIAAVKARLEQVKTGLGELAGTMTEIGEEIEDIRGQEDDAFNNLPPGLQDAENGQRMVASVESLEEAQQALETLLTDLEGLEFPEVENALDAAAE